MKSFQTKDCPWIGEWSFIVLRVLGDFDLHIVQAIRHAKAIEKLDASHFMTLKKKNKNTLHYDFTGVAISMLKPLECCYPDHFTMSVLYLTSFRFK
jgi:hypothetical protein